MLGLVVRVPIHTGIGVGPLYAGLITLQGFFGAPTGAWLSERALWMEWLGLTVLGYFLGWTLTGLSLDYEGFWRIPGRVSAFRALAAAEEPDGPLQSFAQTARGALGRALSLRSLRSQGLELGPLSMLQASYGAVRGAWPAALIAAVFLVADLIRRAVGDVPDLWPSGLALIGTTALMAPITCGSLVLGRAVADGVAAALRAGDSGPSQ